jgi:hypothetical protein
MTRGTLLGIVTVSAAAVGGGLLLVAWSFTPASAEAQLVASLDPGSVQTAGRPHAGGARAASRRTPGASPAPRAEHPRPEGTGEAPRSAKAPRTIAEEVRAQNLDDEERAAYRQEIREERLVDVNARLDSYAAQAHWDEDTTNRIRDLLIDTADHITVTLAAVDRREVEWDDVKGDLRSYRETQAAHLRHAIGPENFDAFVEHMDFARFFGDTPVRGRLE